jgi:hypothetical protein
MVQIKSIACCHDDEEQTSRKGAGKSPDDCGRYSRFRTERDFAALHATSEILVTDDSSGF